MGLAGAGDPFQSQRGSGRSVTYSFRKERDSASWEGRRGSEEGFRFTCKAEAEGRGEL